MFLNLDNPIMQRKTKTIYRDGDKTIKLFAEDYLKSDILNEALNQARVEEGTHLSIPSLIEVSKIENRWALISEYIEGIPLDKLMEQNPEKEDEHLNLFVDTQIMVFSNTVSVLNRIKDKYERKINQLSDITDNARYELLQRLHGMKNHTKLCHGDFNPSNIIIKEDGTVSIIDWAHATIGNASADVANTYMIFVMQDKERLANKYLNLYTEKSGTDRALIQRWLPLVAAVRKLKNIPEEQQFLESWIDVIDYQ